MADGRHGTRLPFVNDKHFGRLARSQYGFRQLADMQYHAFPYHPPGEAVMDWMPSTDAGGLFEVGTVSNTTLAVWTTHSSSSRASVSTAFKRTAGRF